MDDRTLLNRARDGKGRVSMRAAQILASSPYRLSTAEHTMALAAALDELFEMPKLSPYYATMRDAEWR